MKIKGLLLFLVLSLLHACKVHHFVSPTQSVSVEQALVMAQKGILMVDVREPEEVTEQAYAVKNVVNMPLSGIENHLSEIPKNQQVILACRSGNRSGQAYEILKQHGFKNITNMEGGMLAWEENGYPITLPEPPRPYIRVNDTDFSKGRLGNIQDIDLQDLAKFHGHLCDGLVEGFLGLREGLYRLYPDSVVDRTNTRIISKPSPCLTDVAVFLTGGRYQFNTFYVSTEVEGLFVVQRIDNGQSVLIKRRPHVKPAVIDEMGLKAIKGELSACELDSLKKQEDDYMNFLLKSDAENVFEVLVQESYNWTPVLKNDFLKTDVLNKKKSKCN